MDTSNVLCWEGRPSRKRGPPPKTYWEEYVETDTWYQKKLVEDVPQDELWAACYDENFELDQESDDDSSDDILEEEEDDEVLEDDCETTEGDCTSSDKSDGEEDKSVHRTPEGKRRSKGNDGEGTSSSVGESGLKIRI